MAPRAYPGLAEVRERPASLYAAVDSNWADCRDSRRSTAGGALRHGDHLLATWGEGWTVLATDTKPEPAAGQAPWDPAPGALRIHHFHHGMKVGPAFES